ncbi:MAG: helix-turn-helix transcriptional regulator [Promethearchaeota archaeon]
MMGPYDHKAVDFWKKSLKKTYTKTLILYSLYNERKCIGYMITKQFRAQLGHIFPFSAGAIYPQLHQFEEKALANFTAGYKNPFFYVLGYKK